MDPTPQQRTGNAGEALVCCYLEAQGWQVLARQWRCRWGELDIIAEKDGTLALVEVKTRRTRSWDEAGMLAVDVRKQRKLTRAALTFLAEHPDYAELACRFDVALVASHAGPRLLRYIPAAFEVSEI